VSGLVSYAYSLCFWRPYCHVLSQTRWLACHLIMPVFLCNPVQMMQQVCVWVCQVISQTSVSGSCCSNTFTLCVFLLVDILEGFETTAALCWSSSAFLQAHLLLLVCVCVCVCRWFGESAAFLSVSSFLFVMMSDASAGSIQLRSVPSFVNISRFLLCVPVLF